MSSFFNLLGLICGYLKTPREILYKGVFWSNDIKCSYSCSKEDKKAFSCIIIHGIYS